MHGRFDRFSDAQGAPSLRIRVGQRGQHASKSRASRIRRRSGHHLTDVSALGGPMMDRLYRWLTSMVIDCTRRGMHDQADANGPCRGCATAVICRAASHTSRSACPLPRLLRTLHIGGSNLKSRATCDSTVLPRSHTDVPAPSGQRTCGMDAFRRQQQACVWNAGSGGWCVRLHGNRCDLIEITAPDGLRVQFVAMCSGCILHVC